MTSTGARGRRQHAATRFLLALTVVAATGLASACDPHSSTTESAGPPSETKLQESPLSALEKDLVALASVEFAGRGVGTEGGRRATAYLENRLTQAGLQPLETSFRQTFAVDREGVILEGVNLVATVPNGQLDHPAHSVPDCPHPLVVLTAHYDHLGTIDGEVFNGADDNASGVAVAIRVAERVSGGEQPFHLVLALLDAEEIGLRGAVALLERWPDDLEKRIEANLNLDMVGRSDGGVLWVAGAHHTSWLQPIVASLEEASAIKVRGGRDHRGAAPDWTESSDHAVFHRAGIPFLYFGVDDHRDYHQSTDDVEKLDLGFMAAATEVIHNALERMGDHVGSEN